MNRDSLSLYFWLFVSIFSWGSSFVAVKIGLNGLNAFELASYRFTVASLTLIPISILSNFKLPSGRDFKWIIVLSMLGVYAYHLALNYATLFFSPNSISFIANSSPIFTTLFAIIFLQEKVRLVGWIGLLVSMLGVYQITNSDAAIKLSIHSLLLLMIPMLWGVFFILQKPLLVRLKPIEIMSYSIWISTLLFLITSRSFFSKLEQLPKDTHIAATYLGVLPTAIAYLGWSIVLSKIPVSTASSFSYLVPIVTILVSLFLINETPTVNLILGGGLILTGVYLVNKDGRIVNKE